MKAPGPEGSLGWAPCLLGITVLPLSITEHSFVGGLIGGRTGCLLTGTGLGRRVRLAWSLETHWRFFQVGGEAGGKQRNDWDRGLSRKLWGSWD